MDKSVQTIKTEGELNLALVRWLTSINRKIENGSVTINFNNGKITKKEIKEYLK